MSETRAATVGLVRLAGVTVFGVLLGLCLFWLLQPATTAGTVPLRCHAGATSSACTRSAP